jgi:ribulose-5-phosphate 4-epimerase/fuculose-1-phosphate aldolase
VKTSKEFINELIHITSQFVNQPDLIQGPGGNTSVKDESGKMYIKASGYLFKEMNENSGYSCVRYKEIADFFRYSNVISKAEGETKSLQLITENIESDDSGLKYPKPSMETGFHALLGKYVIHTHSVWTNLINCNKNGIDIIKTFEGELRNKIAYIPFVSPGYGLSYLISKEQSASREKSTSEPQIFFLENHGVVVHHDNKEEAIRLLRLVDEKIKEINMVNTTVFPSVTLVEEHNKYIPGDSFCSQIMQKYKVDINFFQKVLFPDQTVFFLGNISFDENHVNKINIDNDFAIFYCANKREAIAIHETLTAFLFIYDTLKSSAQEIRWVSGEEIDYINAMDMEKYRKSLMK